MSRLRWGILAILVAGTLGLALLGPESGGAKLWPPVAALGVILLTRNALVGLLGGAAAGALLLSGGHPVEASVALFQRDLLPHFSSSWKMGAVAFTFLLGGFAGILEAGGGFARLMRSGAGGSARRLEGAAAGLGLVCFFDGLANSMVVGRVTRDLADRQGVARAKLAYIVDSTSSAVACLAFVSTWIAFQLSMIGEAYRLAGHDANPYAVFLQSVPDNFYCWLTLVMLFVAIRMRFHPGPMAGFVAEAELGRYPPAGISADGAEASGRFENEGPIAGALVPLAVLMLSFFAFFLFLGIDGPLLPLTREKIVTAFGSDSGPLVLILSALVASVAALLFQIRRPVRAGRAFGRGLWTMAMPILILVAAWMLGSVISALETARWLSGLAAGSGTLALMPTLVFLTGAVISFSTGTSWGTMGILFPLAVPAAAQLGADPDFLAAIVAAVFSGAVFGDHCSPFSDTTIVSSISCGVTPYDHVRTQLPYALITALVAILTGFLPVGFGFPGWMALALGAAAIFGIGVLGRRQGRGRPVA